jgi:hypothetical protein
LIILLNSEQLYLNYLALPPQVISDYISAKKDYSCGFECFHRLEKCKENNSDYYVTSAGYRGSYGVDAYFDAKGSILCRFSWSAESCRGGNCNPEDQNCPKIDLSSCSVLVG